MGEVVGLGCITKLPVPVERVLNGAVETHTERPLKRVLILGVFEDDEAFAASSESDGGIMLWDMECFRHRLMTEADR